MRRAFVIVLVLGILVALAIREVHLHRKPPLRTAYVAVQGATLWSSAAEVRVPVTTLSYGEPVEIFQFEGDNALISTKTGIRGWVSSALLLNTALWHAAALLDRQTNSRPLQAQGYTRARANLHIRPGRQWEVVFLAPGHTPLELYERQAAPNLERQVASGGRSEPGSEDWWLVRADLKGGGQVSGWVLGRLIVLDPPEPLPEYESSEGMAIVAWFEINHVVDSTGTVKSEYLVMGARQGEGRPCDFTLIRVYTWSHVHHLYETAFVEDNLCGSLPVQVTPAATPGGKAYFRFRNIASSGPENREYEMNDTTVRRIDAGPSRGGARGKR